MNYLRRVERKEERFPLFFKSKKIIARLLTTILWVAINMTNQPVYHGNLLPGACACN